MDNFFGNSKFCEVWYMLKFYFLIKLSSMLVKVFGSAVFGVKLQQSLLK
jgi:hypothetical protein